MGVVGIAAAGVARADSLSLHLQPGYQFLDTRVRDTSEPVSRVTTTESQGYTGVYQLLFQKDLYETLSLHGTGFLQQAQGTSTTNGLRTDTNVQSWNGDLNLSAGQDILMWNVGYTRAESTSSTRSSTDPFALVQPTITRETWAGSARWSPLDLPTLEMRISRDTAQSVALDTQTDLAALTSTYKLEHFRLSASLNYNDGLDRLVDVETVTLAETATGTYQNAFGRTNVFANGTISHISTSTKTTPTSGPVRTRRFPVEGLSLTEGFTDQPGRDTLVTNAAVIDGDLNTSAGLNIGFGPTLSGDQALRDVGVRFVELNPVSLMEVWVDKRLPTGVSSAYAWNVYKSDDNVTWVEVGIVGLVAFHPVENRFDIPIAPTVSRYLKVVTRPLSTAVTPDPTYRDIAITELWTFSVQAAADVRGQTSTDNATLSGAVGTRILDAPNLRYDFQGTTTTSNWNTPSWMVTNSLSLAHKLSAKTSLSANLARNDSVDAFGHRDWRTQWGASIVETPLPTVTSGAAYSGYIAPGNAYGNGATVFGRASLYPGVDANANAGVNLSVGADDRKAQATFASGGTSIVPAKWLTFTGGVVTSHSTSSGGNAPTLSTQTTRMDATMSVTPLPSLFLSAGIARLFGTAVKPTTIFTFAATYSPLTAGTLLLSFSHSENYELATRVNSKVTAASSRWNFASWGYLEGNWAYLSTENLAILSTAQQATVSLAVNL